MSGTTVKEGGGTKTKHFTPVKDPKVFLPFLIERHPQSCYMYNQVIQCDKFKDNLTFYTLSEVTSSESWLISDYVRDRENNIHDISISAPNSVVRDKKPISSEIKDYFSSGDLIDWDAAIRFIAVEKPVSAMIFDVCVNIQGNVAEVHPCYLYYMDKEVAKNISVDASPGTELKRLDPDKDTDYILATWKYAKPGFRNNIAHCIRAVPSAGVYVDGKCTSSLMTFADGIQHCLYTSAEYRKRGFAKLTMKYCFKEVGKEGCHPCTTVEVKNPRSIAFHESLGAKVASIVDFIFMEKLEID